MRKKGINFYIFIYTHLKDANMKFEHIKVIVLKFGSMLHSAGFTASVIQFVQAKL